MSDGFPLMACTWHSITVRCRLIFVVNRAEHILRISISKFMWIKMFSCSKATKLVTYQIESTTDKCLSNRKIVHARTQCAFVSSFEEWKLHRNREKLTKSVSCAHYAWFVSDNGTQRRKKLISKDINERKIMYFCSQRWVDFWCVQV